MSIWTHVNGCIRIDGVPQLDLKSDVQDVVDIMGNTCDWEDSEEIWEKCTVPKGSEGSIQYKILKVGDGMVLWAIPIWGDLRDYDNVKEIEDWFMGIIANPDVWIRSAVLEIEVEGGEYKVITYKNEVENKEN